MAITSFQLHPTPAPSAEAGTGGRGSADYCVLKSKPNFGDSIKSVYILALIVTSFKICMKTIEKLVNHTWAFQTIMTIQKS